VGSRKAAKPQRFPVFAALRLYERGLLSIVRRDAHLFCIAYEVTFNPFSCFRLPVIKWHRDFEQAIVGLASWWLFRQQYIDGSRRDDA
jgi:hypothetical protein